MCGTLVPPVAGVPILPPSRVTPIAALMFACQLVVALGVLIAQILMHFAMLPTVQALVVSLVMLVLEVVMGIVMTFSHALVPIRMPVVIAVVAVPITGTGVAIAPRPDGN